MKRNFRKFLFQKNISKFAVLAIIITLLPLKQILAQTLEVGGFVGASYYLGDLNPKNHFSESNLAYGGVLKYNFNPRWSVGMSITQATLKSDATNFNSNQYGIIVDNLSTPINEIALVAELNFFPYAIGARKTFNWTPYIFGGGSVFSVGQLNGYQLAAPFGLGIKINPYKTIGLNVFWKAGKTFTDGIDNVVSIDYQGYNGDWYFIYGLNLTFAINLQKSKNCRNINFRN